MLSIAHIVIDCADAQTLAGFWSAALTRPVDDGANPYFATIGRDQPDAPALMFLRVPEPKRGKNRLHVDLHGPNWRAEVDRLLGLGATKVSEHGEYGTEWITLTDPEGNEFDVGAGLEN
jgi:hypothetical protein